MNLLSLAPRLISAEFTQLFVKFAFFVREAFGDMHIEGQIQVTTLRELLRREFLVAQPNGDVLAHLSVESGGRSLRD